MISYRARDRLFPYLLILPTALAVLTVIFYPMLYSLNISLREVGIAEMGDLSKAKWVGLQNYFDQLANKQFWEIIYRTSFITMVCVAGAMIIGLIVALVLNQKFVGRKIVRVLILIPWVLPTMVISASWEWIYNGNYGALNGLLYQLGMIDKYRTWLGNLDLVIYALSLVKVWKEIPFVALILLASLQTIPVELYEAAQMDGASAWRRFWHITLPLLRPALLVALVLQTMWAFRIFDIVYALTQGGPANKTMVIAYWTYMQAFKFNHYGTGAALAYIVTIFLMVLSLIYIKLVGTTVEY